MSKSNTLPGRIRGLLSSEAEQTKQGRFFLKPLNLCAAVVLFLMMSLTFFDVFGRYLLNKPIPGSFEITEILLAALIFAGLPMTTLHNEHVSVDLFENWLPGGFKYWRDLLIHLLMLVCLTAVSHRIFLRALEMMDYGDTTAVLYVPLAPLAFFMFAALILTCLVQFLLLARHVFSYFDRSKAADR